MTESFRLEVPSNGYMENKVTIKRTMLPFIGGYAITCYKAQSATYSNCIVDLEGSIVRASPYVQISRVQSN